MREQCLRPPGLAYRGMQPSHAPTNCRYSIISFAQSSAGLSACKTSINDKELEPIAITQNFCISQTTHDKSRSECALRTTITMD